MKADERAQAVYRQMLPMVMSRGNFVAIIADAIHEAEQTARAAALEAAKHAVSHALADQLSAGLPRHEGYVRWGEIEDYIRDAIDKLRAAPAERTGMP